MTRRTWLWGSALAALPRVMAARPARTGVIDGLSVYTAEVGPRAWVLLELRTKEGLTGLGDASAGELVPTKGAAIARTVFETIRGRSPFEIERLRNAALFKVAAAGPREKRVTAAYCSALEQCMWDLQGKTLGLPCYQLFGGKFELYMYIRILTYYCDIDSWTEAVKLFNILLLVVYGLEESEAPFDSTAWTQPPTDTELLGT